MEKLAVKREAAKRMIRKNMDNDYIREVTGLSKRQINSIDKITGSFIGDNDYLMRKKHASLHHLHFGYYFEHMTRFYTGVDLDTSEFYKNKYIQKGHDELNDNIEKMQHYHANYLRIKAILRISEHFSDFDDLISACKPPYTWPEGNIDNYDLDYYIKYDIKDFEEKKMIINLLGVEENLKKIAFICNVKDELVEEVKRDNSMFFKNGRLDYEKLKKEELKWEMELEYEIAKRTTNSAPAIEINSKIFSIEKGELEKFFENSHSNQSTQYLMGKEIVEKLMQDSHSLQDISEISGIEKFYANLIVDDKYYNRYFEKYYDKYADEGLIEYKI